MKQRIEKCTCQVALESLYSRTSSVLSRVVDSLIWNMLRNMATNEEQLSQLNNRSFFSVGTCLLPSLKVNSNFGSVSKLYFWRSGQRICIQACSERSAMASRTS
jgi:hypothetical protein